MKRLRRHFTGEEKVAILRRHLVEKHAVSDLCDELGLEPSVFYRWLKQLFENGGLALERKPGKDGGGRGQAAARIAALEAKLRQKNEVISELLEDHVALKKSLGEI